MAIVNIQYGTTTTQVDVAAHAHLLDAIRAADLSFSAPCGGKGTCGKCEVLIKEDAGTRLALACETEVLSDMTIEITDAAATMDIEVFASASDVASYGVAIDLGTTTLAAELVDLDSKTVVARAGMMNPQLVFGADVISRIEASDNGHLESMRTLVTSGLYRMITSLCAKTKLPLTRIKHITLAGNTVMEHIAVGLSPVSIGVAPYEPLDFFGEEFEVWPDLPAVWFAPCISGYVGGDIVAGMLYEQALPSLLIDLGTNGELALQTEQGSVTAATAAGPVFEGMNITWGMPPLPGAIREASLNEDTGVFTVDIIGGGEAKGMCGSGLIDFMATMLEQGLIDESGRLLGADECSSPLASCVYDTDGVRVFKPLADAPVVITQKDIRNLQLAKAAIAAGIEIILDTAELTVDDIQSLAIAGGFGQHMNKDRAATLGLIPHALLGRSSSIGNSSLEGARKALLEPELREYMTTLAHESNYVELSTDARFSGKFVENMGFE